MRKIVGDYQLVRKLGAGAYAEVFLCKRRKPKKLADRLRRKGDDLVAIKVFNKPALRKQKQWNREGRKMVIKSALNDVEREIALMKRLEHRKIVLLYEVIDDREGDRLYMVLEYVPGGDLMDWNAKERRFKTRDGRPFLSDAEARPCFRDLVEAVAHIHAYGIVHRDIKPENLLLTGDGHCKLGDFGVARLFDASDTSGAASDASKGGAVTDAKGTYAFMAPECLSGAEYSAYQADVWAMGITLYALLTGRLPYCEDVEADLMDAIEAKPVPWPEGLSEGARALLERLLDKDPSTRIGIQELCTHPWVCEGGLEAVPRPDEGAVDRSVSQQELEGAITFSGAVFVSTRLLRAASRAKERVAEGNSGTAQASSMTRNPLVRGAGAGAGAAPGASEEDPTPPTAEGESATGGASTPEQDAPQPRGCCVLQ